MLTSKWRPWAVAALIAGAGVGSAQAVSVVVDFEKGRPKALSNGDELKAVGFKMTVRKEGSVGKMADCFITACPTGNDTQVFSALNDGGLTFRRADRSLFGFTGFDAGFIAPLDGLAGDFSPGTVFAVGVGKFGAVAVESFAFTVDNGQFSFATHTITSPGFDQIRRLTFFACTYNATADCLNPNENLGQFALDNLQFEVTAVPEPGTWALMGLGIAGLALVRRRRAA